MSTISATAGTPLSKHHAASAQAAHQTTSFSQPAKTTATRAPTASAKEEAAEPVASAQVAAPARQAAMPPHSLERLEISSVACRPPNAQQGGILSPTPTTWPEHCQTALHAANVADDEKAK
jgi:hypothetical protein